MTNQTYCVGVTTVIKIIIMKKLRTNKMLLTASIGILAIGSLISCKKDDPVVSTTNTLTDVVVNTPTLSLLKEAAVKSGVDATLRGAGPFTVFAPSNDGFAASGISSATINTLSAADLRNLLLYHTISGSKILAANVPAGPNAKVIMANGDSTFVTSGAAGVFINGIRVAAADVDATNGVAHVLGQVLTPAAGNIVATATAAKFDSLVKAVVRVNSTAGGDPTLISALSSGTLTVFAPTNAAFTNLLTALRVSDINQIPIATLTAVLKYHVVAGRVFSNQLSNGTVAMLAGGNTTVNLTNGLNGGPSISGATAANKANIIKTNVMAVNGVVHAIDAVLIP